MNGTMTRKGTFHENNHLNQDLPDLWIRSII
jgi:hypothetical protein